MLNACTIIACNYLPFAKVLADSFLAHHPDGPFTVLLVDDERRAFAPSPPVTHRVAWLQARATSVSTRPRSAAWPASTTSRSSPRRSSRSCSGACSTTARREVIYLDPDIRIYDSLQPIADLAADTRHRAHAAHDAALSARRARDRRLLRARRPASTTSGSSRSASRRARFSTGGGRRRGARR